MPTYDYLCESNGQVLEVRHSMQEQIATWGELCERLGISAGETDASAPVKKLATGGQVVKSSSLGDTGGCGAGGCGGGVCPYT